VIYREQLEKNYKGELFLPAVANLYEALGANGPVLQLPDWAGDYGLPGETGLKSKISNAGKTIRSMQKEIDQSTKELDLLCLHKLLITGHDNALEGAVDRVLTDLGMEVKVGPKGRVDRTAVHGDRKLAIEVQGVKRGAKEDHARSLIIWVQEVALEDDGKEPKGLLVVNPYRDTPLAERGSMPWTDTIVKICERQGFCAMTGLQLLGLYLDANSDDAKRDELIQQIFDTEGIFVGYEKWQDFLTVAETDMAEGE
jgi:hypothetical protein